MKPEPFALAIATEGPAANIATLRLEQGDSPVVVLDEALIRRLEVTLKTLPATLQGLILASVSTRVFIAGADLKTIQSPADGPSAESDRALDAYLAYGQRVFGMICELPYPTVAAISGAALGGGLELAMHCDALIAAPNPSGKPYPIGLPEAGLSICPGWGGTNLLGARIDPSNAIRMTCTGKPMIFEEASDAKLFSVEVHSETDLISTAQHWIVQARAKMGQPGGIPKRDGMPSRWIGRPESKPRVLSAMAELAPEFHGTDHEPTRAVLEAVRIGLEQGWQQALDSERQSLVRLRNTPGGRAAIQAFFDKSKK